MLNGVDEDIAFISEDMDHHPYLFAAPQDGDCYSWHESLGCYSPIIHLQQVTGGVSAHLPLTALTNSEGVIHPEKVFALSCNRNCAQSRKAFLRDRARSI